MTGLEVGDSLHLSLIEVEDSEVQKDEDNNSVIFYIFEVLLFCVVTHKFSVFC